MSDRLVILGSKGGPAIRPEGPMPTSTLLELAGRRIVVDCGLGVTVGLVDADMHLRDLDLIFITHLHSDHVLEMGPLIHTAWTAGLAKPVAVYGPPGIGDVWDGFCQSMSYDIQTRIEDEGRPDIRELVRINEYGEGPVLDEGGLSVEALRVVHPPVTDCFALSFQDGGRKIVFSADTAYFPPLAHFARNADILVHEAMLEEGVDALVARTGNAASLKKHLMDSHTLAGDAGRIASLAECGHLLLHHLIPADDPNFGEEEWHDAVRKTWSGPLMVARDGLEIRLD